MIDRGLPVSGDIAVLVNPEAGVRRGDTAVLADVIGGRGFVREVRTLAELGEFAHQVRSSGIGVVAICGGDGTLGRVVTAICAECGEGPMPAIAPLGGGTMNTIARSLGLPRGRPEARLARVAAGVARRVRQGTMSFNGERLGFMLGAGVPARFLELYERGQTLGAVRAARILVELLASAVVGGRAAADLFLPVDARITVDGHAIADGRLSVLYAAVIDDIGLGFRPTPRAREREGTFQVLSAHAEAMHLVRALPGLWWRGGVSGGPWSDIICRHLAVALAQPTVYMIDGDVGAATTAFEVHAGPVVDMLVAMST